MDSRRCFLFGSLVIILSLSVIEFLPFLSAKDSNFHGFNLREKRYDIGQSTKEPEKHSFKWYDYVIVSAMLLVSAGTGLYHAFAGGGQRTTSRFLMAERSMYSIPVAISVLASYLSAVTILGFPSEVFYHGIQYWMVAWSFLIVIPITALVFIPVFHGLGLTTAYEYLRKRFSPAVQYAGSVLFIIQTLFYVAIVLFAPAIALETVTDIPLWATIVGTGLLCTMYTALGGIKAVIWTDVFQFIVLFGSLIVVLVFGTIEGDGPSKVWNYNKNHSQLNFFTWDPTKRLSFWSLIIGGAFNMLPIWAVSQTAVQRFLTAKTLREAQKSIWYNLPGNIVMMTIVSLIGLVLFAVFKGTPPTHLQKPDQILIYFVSEKIPQIQGLFIACLFAGTLSTVASGLNALAAVTLIDLVKTYRKGRQTILRLPEIDQTSEEEAAKRQDYRDTVLSKLFTLGYGVITVALAFVAQYMGTLVQMANIVFGAIGGPLLGVFSLGVLYRRANSGGAIIGLMAGAYMGFWISIGAFVNTEENGAINENAFWLYRISFMWYSTVSSLTTIIIGVITSEIIRQVIPGERYREVDPLLLATFLRPKSYQPLKEENEPVLNFPQNDNNVNAPSFGKTP